LPVRLQRSELDDGQIEGDREREQERYGDPTEQDEDEHDTIVGDRSLSRNPPPPSQSGR
jgi:hypothetical protein